MEGRVERAIDAQSKRRLVHFRCCRQCCRFCRLGLKRLVGATVVVAVAAAVAVVVGRVSPFLLRFRSPHQLKSEQERADDVCHR